MPLFNAIDQLELESNEIELTEMMGVDKVKLSLMDIERLFAVVKHVVFLLFHQSNSYRKVNQEEKVKIGAKKQ